MTNNHQFTKSFRRKHGQFLKYLFTELNVANRSLGLYVVLLYIFSTITIYAAGSYYVDGSDPNCSDSGPGTEVAPYCTISRAATAQSGPGTLILVKPSSYREQINVPASGTENEPFIFRALGSPVTVDGADDFSLPSLWTLFAGDVWLGSGVTWSPKQVFVDGTRLTTSSASPSSLPSNTFRYVSGEGLYVNIGGDNPGGHETLIGRRSHGFRLSGNSWITIDGFNVKRTENKGIYLANGADGAVVQNTTVQFANHYGIQIQSCADVVLRQNVVSNNNNHGIALTAGTTNCVVEGNELYLNDRPEIRSANGIYVLDSPNNTLKSNLVFDNDDSGILITSSLNSTTPSDNNISIQNRSWNNGDHGFDHVRSAGTLHVGDVVWGNFNDGFSIEGDSSNTQLFNSISVNNGLTTGGFDLWVDQSSSTGFMSDFNIFWNSTGTPPIKYITTVYANLADFVLATGYDVNSIQSDPRFVNPGGGDFHLEAGSPAIDAADSSVPFWPTVDAEGNARLDDSETLNTGVGAVDYADRGALEFLSTVPPVAFLAVTPTSGTAPLTVVADASGSFDSDGTIVSYRFDFGDGTVVGPQTQATATHSYSQPGNFVVTLMVTDNEGLTDETTATVTVITNTPPVASLTVTPTSGRAPLAVVADASGSFDPDGTIISYRFDFGDGTVVGPQTQATATHVYGKGNYRVNVEVVDDHGAIGAITSGTIRVRKERK